MKLNEITKETKAQYKTITVECNHDAYINVMKLLNYLKYCGDVGHSCSLHDENGDGYIASIDGDGNDRIGKITPDEPKYKYKER